MLSKFKWLLLILVLVFGLYAASSPIFGHPRLGVTNFDAVELHCVDCSTGTPVLVVDQASGSGSGMAFEVRGNSTPVFSISRTGVLNVQGGQIVTQALTYVIVNAPTAIGTATPAALIDNAGVSNLLEVRDSATPVFIIGQAGAWSSTGAGTHSGGQTTNNWVKVAAPTAIATATPAAVIDSAGVSNLLEVRKNATPVFSVSGAGAVAGLVEQSNQSGTKCVYGTQTVTGTGTIATGLSTPVAVQVTLAQTLTVNGAYVSYANSAGVVTAQVWQIPATPGAVAATTPVAIAYRACGTP